MGFALKTIAPDLLDDLNALASSSTRSELDIVRVQRAALPLKTASPADYFMIEGICESLRGRLAAVRTAFDKAIKLGGWNVCVAENYAICLHEAGDIPGSWEVIDRGLASFGDDPQYLKDTFGTLLNTGAIARAASVEERLIKMKVERAGSVTWASFQRAIVERGLKPELVGEIIRHSMAQVKAGSTARPTLFYSFTTGVRNEPHLSLGFVTTAPIERLHAMELQMIETVDSLVEDAEASRNVGAPSILDFVSLHLQSEQSHGPHLHAA